MRLLFENLLARFATQLLLGSKYRGANLNRNRNVVDRGGVGWRWVEWLGAREFATTVFHAHPDMREAPAVRSPTPQILYRAPGSLLTGQLIGVLSRKQ